MARLFTPLRWLLRTLWRFITFVRLLLANLMFLLFIILLLFALTREESALVPTSGALVLNLAGEIVEQSSTPAAGGELLRQWLGSAQAPRELVVGDILYAISRAKQDPDIKGIVLKLQDLESGSFGKLHRIAQALDDFRSSGKPVLAAGDFFTQHQYLLAAHADTLLLNPAGGVLIQGLGLYNLYFKSALEKLDIQPHIFRVGTYKSFIEPYSRDDMSAEAREANGRWLNQLWDLYVQDVTRARNIPADAVAPSKEQLLARMQQAGGNAAQYALAQGLVDQLATREEIQQAIMAFAGQTEDGLDYPAVDLASYLRRQPSQYADGKQPKVGLIVAAGMMQNGKQPPGSIGGESLAELVLQAARDEQIKALVLRIDSPGGSAFAAEQIRTELLALKAAGKPLVVSMGSTAASGGYWIAANADKIFAEPSTLTGSIGVFGLYATADKALAKLGIRSDGLGTTDFTGLDPSRPLPEHVKQLVQMSVEDTYRRFVQLVAEGRGMTPDAVDKVAQGHVWTGQDAQRLGLVDGLGSLDEAIRSAAELANLSRYQVSVQEAPLSPTERLLRQLFGEVALMAPTEWRAPLQSLWQQLSQSLAPLAQLDDPRGLYSVCLACRI